MFSLLSHVDSIPISTLVFLESANSIVSCLLWFTFSFTVVEFISSISSFGTFVESSD